MTPCPHCHNTLKNEYPQFGGKYEVQHHSALLAELVGAGRLSNTGGASIGKSITLHDPCYLARVNGEVDATRVGSRCRDERGISRNAPARKENFLLRCRRGTNVVRRAAGATRLKQARGRGTRDRCEDARNGLPILLKHDDRTGWRAHKEEKTLKVLDIAELLLDQQTAT